MANVTATEACFFSKYDVLLDNEASLNVFSNRDLVKNLRKSTRSITMHGVESNSSGVNIEMEGEFNEIGTVFVSEKASANILSFARSAKIHCDPQRTDRASLIIVLVSREPHIPKGR